MGYLLIHHSITPITTWLENYTFSTICSTVWSGPQLKVSVSNKTSGWKYSLQATGRGAARGAARNLYGHTRGSLGARIQEVHQAMRACSQVVNFIRSAPSSATCNIFEKLIDILQKERKLEKNSPVLRNYVVDFVSHLLRSGQVFWRYNCWWN